jgi:Ca2+-binding EF-hand superfamily protein
MLELAFDHLDLDGSGTLSVSEIVGFCRGLNPIKVHAEVRAMIRQMDKDGDESISRTEYLDSMSALADCLGDEEFERGILETLATKPLISDLTDRESKMTALFRHLDADASGDLEVDELLAVFVDDAEVDPIEARRKAKAQLAYLDEDGDGTVDLGEFIDAMSFLTSYLSDEDFDAQIEEQMSYDRFTYKCDAAYLGPKGVLALLPCPARMRGAQRDVRCPARGAERACAFGIFGRRGKPDLRRRLGRARGTGRGDAEPEASRVRRVLLRARIL